MAATGLLLPIQQFFDNDGNPLAGGFLYTYAAGTSTPQPTYLNSDLAPGSANTNPIELDSAGRAVIYCTPTPALSLLLTDADDVPIWTQDEVSPAAVAS